MNSNDEFDLYYSKICELLKKDGRCAPYKMAWLEYFERNIPPEEAVVDGPSEKY